MYPSVAQQCKLQPGERNSLTPCQKKQSSLHLFPESTQAHLEGFFPHKKHVSKDIKVPFSLGLEPETERQRRKISVQLLQIGNEA
ncbi:rCG56329, isoform CRA_b [Rattus norvegicus]|uniref:RCG56329, isoform CRA_b n=1 Tax=Rattus norvegicus TaxID=10116 RepID=A6IBD1_RAT|nr:rCG56329, isoform CRA_b [Rattus norvegicus]EDL91398.1 rCG56329, isoform CRA_b [Rattus norvegicus]EDL91399.1 rCG56329, isoform CRA_b [Rattus norvegicus]